MPKVNNYDTRTTSHIVLYGTIIALKLFYILSVITLSYYYARCMSGGSILALTNCSAKHEIDLEITRNYESFFK